MPGNNPFIDQWGRIGSDWNGIDYVVWGYAGPQAPAATLPSPTATATSTGVNPVETSYSLYGHTVPLSVFGFGRIGGEIIAGPWISNGMASFCISFGHPADPSGTRDIREIAFDSEVVWTTNGAAGVTTTAGGTFNTEPVTCRFYGGTLTQAADPLEIAHFGANAVAYRPQMLLWFENLPLAGTKFGKIPYVAAVIGDASGDDVNLGEAFQRIAASPWVNFAKFETSGITDGLPDGGLIIAQDQNFLQLIQQFGRFYPQWTILQTDKLRIVDRGAAVAPDVILDATRLVDGVKVNRQGQDTVSKDLELSTIDPNADYTIVPSLASRPRDPVAVTTSIGKDTAYLPAIMDASTRTAIVTLAKYHEEATRKTISGTAMAYGLEIEPGDLVGFEGLGADFHDETFKIVETTHGANNVVEFVGQSILDCEIAIPSYVAWDAAETWDPTTAVSVTVSGGNLAATNSGSTSLNQGVWAHAGKTSGKRYFEITFTTLVNTGSSVVTNAGVGTPTSTFVGIGTNANDAFTVNQLGISTVDGSGATASFGQRASGDVICFAIDLDNKLAWVRLAPTGDWNFPAAGANPTTGTGGISLAPLSGALTPVCTFGDLATTPGNIIIANFGASPFVGVVP